MRFIKKYFCLAVICFALGFVGYSFNSLSVSAEDDAAFSTPEPSATAAPSETAQPSETLQPSETEEPEPTKLPPLVSYEKTKKKLQLKYDDRYTFSKEVRRVETESVTSTKVKTGKKDTKVISVANAIKRKFLLLVVEKQLLSLLTELHMA